MLYMDRRHKLIKINCHSVIVMNNKSKTEVTFLCFVVRVFHTLSLQWFSYPCDPFDQTNRLEKHHN